jgi:hypothetical protein
MTVQKLSSIVFNGTKGEAYGGNIYNFRIESNGIESPASYIVSVAYSSDRFLGRFSLGSFATISIKDIVIAANLKLFSATTEKTPEYTAVHLKYVDQSDFLDKTYIGLNYRHGYCESRVCKNSSFVLLGGNVVETELEKECIDCSDKLVVSKGIAELQTCSTSDAGYTVEDFIAAFPEIENIGFLGRAGTDILSYTGTLREVLSSICSDAGASFMVNYRGSVIIIDGSNGIEIADADASKNVNLKKTTEEISLEGTYAQDGGTFSIKPTSNLSQTRENYTQFILAPVNATVTQDVILGLVGMRGPGWRDAACLTHNLYHRLGFYNGLYSVNPGAGIEQNNMIDLANCMQDSSLLDLVSQGYTRWHLTRFSDEIKNYYINLESQAANDYGTLYRANIAIPPTNGSRSCLPGDFRKVTSYEVYPDVKPDRTWRKGIGPRDITATELGDLDSYNAPVVVPLVGELAEKYAMCIKRMSGGFLSDMTNAVFIGFKSTTRVDIEIGSCIHPDEELKKPIKQVDSFCVLPCEEDTQDICNKLNKPCSRGSAGIVQGSQSNIGTCIGGIVLPSASIYYGWIKQTDDMSKAKPGEFKINGNTRFDTRIIPNISANNVQSVRYSLVDASNNPNAVPPKASFFAQSTKRTYEIIGEFVPALHPSLSSWNISIDSNGMHTTVSYQNRPPLVSKQDQSLSKTASKKILLRS